MEFAKEEGGHVLYRLFCPKEIFLTFVFYLNVQCIEYIFRRYVLLHIKKKTSYTFLLVFEIVVGLQNKKGKKQFESFSKHFLGILWNKKVFYPYQAHLKNLQMQQNNQIIMASHISFLVVVLIFFSFWVFFHEHLRFTGQQGKGGGYFSKSSLPLPPPHRHLDISRAITAESHLCAQLIAGLEPETFGFRAQVTNH